MCSSDLAGEILAATKGCAIASYNVYFDIKFLTFEMSNAGVAHDPPHFCLMYLRPMLGLGSRCKLQVACQQHGIDYQASHVAANDAMAAGQLFCRYLPEFRRQNVATYSDLAALRSYKFNNSFSFAPFPEPATFGLRRFDGAVSRAGFAIEADPHHRDNEPPVWRLALTNMLADAPDFLIDLGDTFMEEKTGATNAYYLTRDGILDLQIGRAHV